MDGAIGVLFDMDGVLVDSEPVILAAAIAGLKEYGVSAKSEDFVPFIGAGEDRYIGGVAEKYGLEYKVEMKERVYEIYLDMVDSNLRVFDGTVELLNKLKQLGCKLALASSADRIKIDANLRVAGIDKDIFSAIISGEEVKEKKPSPEIYLKAAERIGIAPERCIVVEDAVNGIKSAQAAGMKSIGITTSFDEKTLLDEGADFVCDRIQGVYDIIYNILHDK
mgnify:CR=1 FL=1